MDWVLTVFLRVPILIFCYASCALGGKSEYGSLKKPDCILHVAKKERRVERNYTIAKTAILVGLGRGSRRTLWSFHRFFWNASGIGNGIWSANGPAAGC